MLRTSLLLPKALKEKADRAAARRGLSLGALIREQLALVVDRSNGDRRENDPLFANFVPYRGNTAKDLAERHDDYLYGED